METLIFILIIVIILSIAVHAFVRVFQAFQKDRFSYGHTFDVAGQATISEIPDIAFITLGVKTDSESASEALSKNTKAAQAVMKSLNQFGVESKDIRTSSFEFKPEQDINRKGEISRSYFYVENTVDITVRNLERVGEILDRVVSSGANTITSVTFDVTNKEKLLAEARIKAIDDAKQKAFEMAKAAGLVLGPVQSIIVDDRNITQNWSRRYYPSAYDQRIDLSLNMDIPISAGEESYSVTATLGYKIA